MKIEIIKSTDNNPVAEFFSSSSTPETDAFAIKFKTPCGKKYWVPFDIARKLERERDEAMDANKKLREVLEWIAERYDDSKPMHQVAMDAYEMSCTARAALRKEATK